MSEYMCSECKRSESDLSASLLTIKKCGHFLCYDCGIHAFGVDAMSDFAMALGLRITAAPKSSLSRTASRKYLPKTCSICKTVFGVTELSAMKPEDEEYRRECDIRKRLSRVFNKTLEDFGYDAEQYNDYLEKIEQHVARLVSGTASEKAETEAAIKAYTASNYTSIAFNAAKNDAALRNTAEKIESDTATRVAAAKQQSDSKSNGTSARSLESLKHKLYLLSTKLTEEQLTQLKVRLLSKSQQAIAAAGSRAPAYTSNYVPCPSVLPPKPLDTASSTSSSTMPSSTSSGKQKTGKGGLVELQRRAGGCSVSTLLQWDLEDAMFGLSIVK